MAAAKDKDEAREAAVAAQKEVEARADREARESRTNPEPAPEPAPPEHPEPNRLPSDQLVVTGDTKHPEVVVDHKTNETELANPADEDNYAGGPEYKPV